MAAGIRHCIRHCKMAAVIRHLTSTPLRFLSVRLVEDQLWEPGVVATEAQYFETGSI